MRILNIADSHGEMLNEKGEKIVWDNWIINCIDNNPADGKRVQKPNGSGEYVCGNAIVQFKIKKQDFAKYFKGDIKDIMTKDFNAYFTQDSQLVAVSIK